MDHKSLPKVSVIIPFYKNFGYLKECVAHCLALDYSDYEVIVVSNSPVGFDDERIKVVVTDDVGQACKKDLGIAHASGEICAFIDDDAYPRKDWIRNALKYFKEPSVVAVGGPGVTPSDDGLMQKAGGLVYSLPIGSGRFYYRYVADETNNADALQGYNLFVRKIFFKEVGEINVRYRSGEDNILSERIAAAGKDFVYAPDVVVFHHRRPLFIPHLKQISTYALHRGYFMKRYPAFSKKFPYVLPSMLLLGIVLWALLSISIPMLRLPLVAIISGYFALSFAFALSVSRSIRVSALTSVGVVLSHLTYAIHFIRGFFMRDIGERPSY